MKKLIILSGVIAFMYACSGNADKKEATDSKPVNYLTEDSASKAVDAMGIGKFTHVALQDKLDEGMAKEGNAIYDLKCSACHKLTKEKLVGPGWKDVTTRRKPEWILNF